MVSFVIERMLSKKSPDKVVLDVNSNNFKLFKDQDYFKVKSLLRNNFGIVDRVNYRRSPAKLKNYKNICSKMMLCFI